MFYISTQTCKLSNVYIAARPSMDSETRHSHPESLDQVQSFSMESEAQGASGEADAGAHAPQSSADDQLAGVDGGADEAVQRNIGTPSDSTVARYGFAWSWLDFGDLGHDELPGILDMGDMDDDDDELPGVIDFSNAEAYRDGGFGGVPAAAAAIAGLERRKHHHDGPGEEACGAPEASAAAVCAVCLDAFDSGSDLSVMPCKHRFHESCLGEWLARSRLCPCCRHALPSEAQYARQGVPAIAATVAALCIASLVLLVDGARGEELAAQLENGFTATHAAGATAPFEPVLYSPNGVFAFGFLRVGSASLDLAVVHLPSSFPVWRATPARLGDWSRPAKLTFDSSLILTDHEGGVLWQTLNAIGDTVVLLNSSNLVVRRYSRTVLAWQSFDNPSDTLVTDQNFTASTPPLISNNRRFALRLGKSYMALYMEIYGGRSTQMYWQRTAMEAQPENATQSPVHGHLDGRGFFGLYRPGGSRTVDVLSFDTFAQNITGVFRRMTLDDDGNLRAYYWTPDSKEWTSDFKAISGRCALPTSCGAYGLCVPGQAQCQCLTGSTRTSPPCHAEEETADLCSGGGGGGQQQLEFDVVRREGVSVAYKERLPFETYKTAAECELACAANCSCWGAVYNGASGYCYLIDFPVQTLLYQADERKVGYFKVRKASSSTRRGMSPGVAAATAVLSLLLASLVAAGAYTGYRMWRKRRRGAAMEQELAPGPYKDLKSMASSNNSFKA
ncbi:hypothetical protein ACP70R_020440 [Stipagrostis hirtigluma subsp. patula]